MRRAPAALAALLAVAALLALLARSWLVPTGPDWVQGIDVSHHQGEIDWPAVAGDGVAFAWIKASEGADWTDPRFAENWRGAGEAGVQRGAYHFFTLCTPGAAQADWFLAQAPPAPGDLPPAVDLEYGGNCDQRPTSVALGRQLRAFQDRVQAATGQRPLVYVTAELMADHPGLLDDEVLWARSLFHPVRWGTRAPVRVWQHSNLGRVAGIEGRVDRNAWRRGTAW